MNNGMRPCIKKGQTLYLIGNGFDIAHGINTSYSVFRDFLKNNHADFLTKFEEMYSIYPLDDSEPGYTEEAGKRHDEAVNNILWKSFEEEIGKPDVDSMHSMAESMVDGMPSEGIKDTLDLHWSKEYGFVKNLQGYVLEWITAVDVSEAQCKKQFLMNDDKDYFISFNYTDTLERVYEVKNVRHIHGGIPGISTVKPIIGHGNKKLIKEYKEKAFRAGEDYIEWEESINDAIVQYANNIYKDTDKIIQQNQDFFDKIQSVDTVVVFGLSFGNVDIPYLQKIMNEVSPNTKWIVYYHNEAD